MKVRSRLLMICLLAVALLLSACGSGMGNMDMGGASESGSETEPNATADPNADSDAAEEVSVVGSNWKWELSKTEFKVGETVNFSIQSKEGIHGFAIAGTDIDVQISPGETKTITWTPEEAGEYTILCSVMCGTGHADMIQKITVSE